MKILLLGDISAKPGRLVIKDFLQDNHHKDDYDLVIGNCENATHGLGATPEAIDELHSYGIDFFTSGNDIWKKESIFEYLGKKDPVVIRPLNYPDYFPGVGYRVLNVKEKKILVINLIGQVFMKEEVLNPFHTINNFLNDFENGKYEYALKDMDLILVDFHAEATAEKVAMGFYLDGKVGLVAGTHTHVQTSDERILPKGTAYITDMGMCGSINSVLWTKTDIIINKMLKPYLFQRFEPEENKPWMLCGVEIETDENSTVRSIKRVNYVTD